MRVLKIALIVRKGQKPPNFPLKGYVPRGWWNSVWTTIRGMKHGKNQKGSLDVRKMSKKVKLPSKLFFQLPIWRQNSSFINKAANFLPQIRQFLAQSRKLFHKINIMFWSKCLTGHVKFNFDNFVDNFLTKLEKSSLKLDTKLKKKAFWKKIDQKFLGRLECKFDKTDETFLSKLRFFSLEPEVKLNMTNYCKENL